MTSNLAATWEQTIVAFVSILSLSVSNVPFPAYTSAMLTVPSPDCRADVGLIDECAALHALHLGLQVGNGVVRSDDIEHDLVGRGHGQDYRAQVVDDRPGRILDGRP